VQIVYEPIDWYDAQILFMLPNGILVVWQLGDLEMRISFQVVCEPIEWYHMEILCMLSNRILVVCGFVNAELEFNLTV
jgi:hypothetical protein